MVDRQFAEPRLAELYDQFHPWPAREDFRFYLPLVMSAGAVLDVGCGTGALLRRARDRGHTGRLCGLDPAPAMLAVARTSCSDVEWVLGDLTSASWEREFDLIVMTGHAFQVLLRDDDIRSSLSSIRSALSAEGRFGFETRNPAFREWDRWTPGNAVQIEPVGGAAVRMAHQVDTPVTGDLVSFTTTFTSSDWDRPQRSRSTLRFLDAAALAVRLAEAGLAVEEQFGDWDRRPVADTAPEIITLARRR